ncbi:hypothetical protein [Flammeovirga sp. SJP92]|uniref:hypothetical protein n=1 Tax=Flammeovirga sp. SJP92 TaxID=1775430 RepID=UPI000787FD1E|nr:hypothetical protein [Flammeovirga sp. SJP92]KXX71366.1 hypothetical protein AVL50_32435 [Flammeovirga sp. SJP92]
MSNSKTSIQFPKSFNVLKEGPIDDRSSFETLVKRDALKAGQRYEGMITYVSETKKFYYLDTGLTNADWKLFNPADQASEGVWKKIQLPSRDNFVLKTTENTSPEYVEVGEPYPKGLFKVKLEILGIEYEGACYAQYDAMFMHGRLEFVDNEDHYIKLIPITPLFQAVEDAYGTGKEPFYKLPDEIGLYEKGKVGFELNDGSSVDSEEAWLYYPAEVGELVVETQTAPV